MQATSSTPSWKNKIESKFGDMSDSVYRHPWLWLCLTLIVTSFFGYYLTKVYADTAVESFLAKDDPSILAYNDFRAQFGRDEIFLITMEVGDVFDQKFIEQLRGFHQELEDTIPYLDTVDSLINARHTYGADDTLFIEDLLAEQLPSDAQALQKLKDYTYSNPVYENYLLSKDKKLATIVVKLKPFTLEKDDEGNIVTKNLLDYELEESYHALFKVVNKYQGKISDDVQVGGSIAVGIYLGAAVRDDFTLFSALAIVIIGAILALLFRRVSGVLMPLCVMIFAVVATVGSMGLLAVPIQLTTSILPSFLLAVCVGDSVHLLSIFYQHYDQGKTKQQALRLALEHTGLAMFFTSITTGAGLMSFSTSEIYPVASLGIFGAIGAMMAFFYTIFMLPCLIRLLPLKAKAYSNKKSKLLTGVTNFSVYLSTQHPVKVVLVSAVLFIGSVGLCTQLTFTHDPITWFKDGHPLKVAVDKIEHRLGGAMPLEMTIDTGTDGGATSPAVLKQLEALLKELVEDEKYDVNKAISLVDVIKETNRALNDNDQNHYKIPDSKELIRQELFLVELDEPDQLYLLVDRDLRTLRVTLMIPWFDAIYYTELIARVDQRFKQALPNTKVEATGLTVILSQTFSKMLFSTAQSYMLAGVIISIMMVFLIGSLKNGLLSMVASLLPILIVLASMHVFSIPLDMFAMLIGSIAIGLTVDDNVHFMHGFRRVYLATGDAERAVRETLESTGKAMIVTTIVLAFGFMIYTQSTLNNLNYFGVITAACLTLALFSVFILAPALMVLANKNKPASNGNGKSPSQSDQQKHAA